MAANYSQYYATITRTMRKSQRVPRNIRLKLCPGCMAFDCGNQEKTNLDFENIVVRFFRHYNRSQIKIFVIAWVVLFGILAMINTIFAFHRICYRSK